VGFGGFTEIVLCRIRRFFGFQIVFLMHSDLVYCLIWHWTRDVPGTNQSQERHQRKVRWILTPLSIRTTYYMKTPEGCEQFVTLSLLFSAWSRGTWSRDVWSRDGFCGEVPALTTAVDVGLFTFLSLLSTVNYHSIKIIIKQTISSVYVMGDRVDTIEARVQTYRQTDRQTNRQTDRQSCHTCHNMTVQTNNKQNIDE